MVYEPHTRAQPARRRSLRKSTDSKAVAAYGKRAGEFRAGADAAGARVGRAPAGSRKGLWEVRVRVSLNRKNPFAFLFARSKREDFLARYVLREHRRGRRISEILDDAYVRNRSTPQQRSRLLERPEVIAAIGDQAVKELRLGLGGRAPS
jgi:hypothetical protein